MSNDSYVICLGNAFEDIQIYGPYRIEEATHIATTELKDTDWNIVLVRKPKELNNDR